MNEKRKDHAAITPLTYYNDEQVTIYHGCALNVMCGLADIDLVMSSPPYEDARTYGIDFKLKGQSWVDWYVPYCLEMSRICHGLVALVVEGRQRNFRYSATPQLLMADLHNRGIKLRKPPVFHRVGIPGSGGPDWLRNDYENIVCFAHGKLPWSNNTACGHPPKYAPGGEMSHRIKNGSRVNQWGGVGSKKGMGNKNKDAQVVSSERPSHRMVITQVIDGQHSQTTPYHPPAIANPGNVIKRSVGGAHMGSKLSSENEAPFPESLVDFFVKSFCPPGGVVFDPMAGSGTVGASAIRLGRKVILCDVREDQCELMVKRIKETREKMVNESK